MTTKMRLKLDYNRQFDQKQVTKTKLDKKLWKYEGYIHTYYSRTNG